MPSPSPLSPLSRSDQINQLIGGYGYIAMELVAEGWTPYLLVLKFQHLGGRRDTVLAQMKREAERAHGWLCERVWRNAKAPSRRPWMPCWILVPDFPVAKRAKVRLRELVPNDGLHLQGVAVMPPEAASANRSTSTWASAARATAPGADPSHRSLPRPSWPAMLRT